MFLRLRHLAAALLLGLAALPALAGELTLAAAADLKFALEEVAAAFRAAHPDDRVNLVFGSSGKFFTQIQNGAPFDLYLSADISYPRKLVEAGLAAGEAHPYAVGRIVLWSLDPALAKTALADLPQAKIKRFAIANPAHAPYGLRAQEALRHAGVWEALEPRLVMGENIAQTAQYVESGAAQAGIVALSLVLSPTLEGKGAWTLIPADWHEPLEQGFVILKRAADNPLAAAFSAYLNGPEARAVLRRYGFVLPGEGG